MFEFTTDDLIIKSLACAALNPGLRSILIFDAPYPVLQQLADILAQMLASATRQVVEPHLLSASAQDDDLWGSLPLPVPRNDSLAVKPAFKLFSQERNAGKIQLITVPDLAKLSLAAARSCVMLVGADVAHLERNGQRERWQPQQWWLAGCSSVGAVSPHLLDRFALRLSWKKFEALDRQQRATDLLATVPVHAPGSTVQVAPQLLQQIARVARQQVVVTPAVLARVMDYVPEENYYPRREFALARFALALAQLADDRTLIAEHVDEAAAILGLEETSAVARESQQPANEPEALPEPTAQQPAEMPASAATVAQDTSGTLVTYTQEATPVDLITTTENVSHPYPEDEAPIEREATSLKIPYIRFSTSRSDRGPIYGVEQSDSLRDLAIVSTLTAAAMHQRVRGRDPAKQGLLIDKSDLRRYRRGYVTEQMLMLLLDYTSLRDCNWQDAILPYLSKAYTERASIAIIKVGARDAAQPLQAETISARNILVPRVGAALAAQHGAATPLAHGLDLALQTLHRALQHGRSAAQKVTFVVISDGRGNIPLEASRQKKLPSIITRGGVEDALQVASAIRDLKRVEAVVLNPRSPYYAELPQLLAEALGAQLVDVPTPANGWEVAQ